ncbi:NAD(P)H-dependent oxidoreductase [Klenkia sp. PcliD-1-E]|uniref:NADPH-dependent FMN reductase n=1 Tax=Klenkia sp. PcliD-1-E TaxID=2954492 RepID=UPI002097D3EA|nr:NAD(P)H-dependent oxidoreductase [Klenkia sp. PcliD-1-E]MCO7219057.1 NAD(P)H-dependent oxidoreductase [Klenkia sp. PcliD-1-E]
MKVLGVVGSPSVGGRTDAGVAGVLAGCLGAETEKLSLADTDVPTVLDAMEAADAVVFGSPTYRASFSSLLRNLFENAERGRYTTETKAHLAGTTAAIVMTNNAPEHFLAQDSLRSLLAGFYGCQVLSPGLVLTHPHFDGTDLTADAAELAAAHGRALVDLTRAVHGSAAIRALQPQV